MEIITRSAKEKILIETIQAYHDLYPAKFYFIKAGLRRLREVTPASHRDTKGREIEIPYRVPSEPFLFLQTQIPGFGEDSDDVALLCRCWEDVAVATRDRRQKSRLYVARSFKENAAK